MSHSYVCNVIYVSTSLSDCVHGNKIDFVGKHGLHIYSKWKVVTIKFNGFV